MEGVMQMSLKAIKRAKIMEMIKQKKLTQKEAAERLNLSLRQVKRIYKKYLEKGDIGLNHGLMGKPGNHRKDELRNKCVSIYRKNFLGWGPTLAAEQMKIEFNIEVKPQTLRIWLVKEGLWEKKRKSPKHRLRRARKKYFGEMIQIDGSIHDWFGTGKKSCLITMVDDATGIIFGLFDTGETTDLALRCLYEWVKRYGIPESIYSDRKKVYHTEREPTLEEQLAGEEPLTEFGKVCKELGIEIIKAYSPQAKGRIERGNRVHQDRLIKLLQRKKIKTIEEANRYLLEEYLDRHNSNFAKRPACEEDRHIPLLEGQNLNDMVCYVDKRVVSNDNVIRYKNRKFQILKNEKVFLMPGDKVTVKKWLDGSIHIYKNNTELDYYEIDDRGYKINILDSMEKYENGILSLSKERKAKLAVAQS